MGIQMKRTTVAASVLSVALLLAGSAHAQSIYKCRNAAGKIDLSDRPCSADSKTEAIRDGSAISESRRQEAAQVAGANRSLAAKQENERSPTPVQASSEVCDAASRAASGGGNLPMGRKSQLIEACNATSKNPSKPACQELASVALNGSSRQGQFSSLLELCDGGESRTKAQQRPCAYASDINCVKTTNY